jgi:DUF1009 family protein
MGRRIGVIAGSGEFPFLLLAEAQKMGYSCVGDILSFFKKNGVKEAVFAGKIDHRKIFDKEKFNEDSRRLLAQSKDRGAAAVLKTIIDFMDKKGIQIMDPTLFIASSFCQEGVLTKTEPSSDAEEDIEFGFKIAKNIADLDIGQTVIIKDKTVVAVEGMEGTEEAIRRGGRLAGEETVVVKVSRSFQDARVDLPAVGLDTVKSLVEARSKALCFEAQSMPFFQKEEAISLADAHRISIIVKKP